MAGRAKTYNDDNNILLTVYLTLEIHQKLNIDDLHSLTKKLST